MNSSDIDGMGVYPALVTSLWTDGLPKLSSSLPWADVSGLSLDFFLEFFWSSSCFRSEYVNVGYLHRATASFTSANWRSGWSRSRLSFCAIEKKLYIWKTNSNAVSGTVKSNSAVTYSTLIRIALARAILSKPVEHYLVGLYVRLAQNVLTSGKMLVDVNGHNHDRFLAFRAPQPVAYSRKAGGL